MDISQYFFKEMLKHLVLRGLDEASLNKIRGQDEIGFSYKGQEATFDRESLEELINYHSLSVLDGYFADVLAKRLCEVEDNEYSVFRCPKCTDALKPKINALSETYVELKYFCEKCGYHYYSTGDVEWDTTVPTLGETYYPPVLVTKHEYLEETTPEAEAPAATELPIEGSCTFNY